MLQRREEQKVSGRVEPLGDAEDDEVAMYFHESVLNQISRKCRLEKARSKAVTNKGWKD